MGGHNNSGHLPCCLKRVGPRTPGVATVCEDKVCSLTRGRSTEAPGDFLTSQARRVTSPLSYRVGAAMVWGKPVSEGDQGLRKKPAGRSIERSREGAAASLCSRPRDMRPSCRLAAPPKPWSWDRSVRCGGHLWLCRPVSQCFPSTLSLRSGQGFIKAFLAGHTGPFVASQHAPSLWIL